MKLYVAFDLFHAGAYRAPDGLAGAEDYSHDKDFYYVVLQPLLIHGSNVAESPSLAEYFGWNRQKLAEPDRVQLAGVELARALRQENVSVTPVPFPPDAVLNFKLRWENGGATVGRIDVNRDLAPAASPFRLDPNRWPELAARNFMSLPIRTWSHLSAVQVTQLFDWAYGLLLTLQSSPKSDKETAFYNEFFQPDVNDDFSRDRWQQILLGGGNPTRLERIMKALWENGDFADQPRLQPPSFRYTPEEIRTHGTLLFPNPEATYHKWLWEQLKAFLAQAGAEGKDRVSQALGRLFGFGERLRWPQPAADALARDFMIVLPRDEDAADPWLVTNVHSLTGQVFRLGPLPSGTAIDHFEVEELTVGPHPLFPTEAAEDELENRLLAFRNEAARYAAQDRRFSASAARDTSFPKGRVWFLPRNARAQSTDLTTPDVPGETLFTVPGSLLDALEPTPRSEAPLGTSGGTLARLNPQRIFLKPDELVESASLPGRRFARIKLQVREIPLSKRGERDHVYELALTGDYQEAELGRIKTLLGTAGDSGSGAALWVERQENGERAVTAFPLAGKVLSFETQGPRPALVVADPGGVFHELLPKLPPPPPLPGGNPPPVDPNRSRQNLVLDFLRPVGTSEPFNALAASGEEGPLLVLRDHFEHRVSRSAERLLERFGLGYDPQPPGTVQFEEDGSPDQPILRHFANFNKLRLTLRGPGNREIRLNHPDALIPLPQPGTSNEPSQSAMTGPGAPPHSYWVAHQFSEEIRGPVQETEESHYAAYLTAGESWSVTGQAEHQYSHKTPLNGQLALTFPLSTDARNLASLSLPLADTGGESKPLPALTYDHRPGNPETIAVRLEPGYVKEALRRMKGEGPARLRALYEALSDLAAGAATLRLERWNFDNSLTPSKPEDVADPDTAVEFPGIVSDLRFDGAATHVLSAAEKQPFVRLLGASFAEFTRNLEAVTDRVPLPSLPLAGGTWSWGAGQAPAGDSLAQTTNVIRLGLQIERPEARVIRREDLPPAEAFVPLPIGKNLQEADRDTATRIAAAMTGPGPQTQARKELEEALDPATSPLRHSFAWIVSDDEDYKRSLEARATQQGFDQGRGQKIFGESYPYLNFPTGLATREPRVCDLFYVPYAFRPLATHPKLGDPQTTQEFTEYLISILSGVARGRALDELEVKTETPPDLKKAWEHREAARRTIAESGGVSDRLEALLDRVDGENPAGDTLFDKVQILVANIAPERREVLRELLAADPSLFATSKAVALGVFDPERFSDRLYALEVTKTIRPQDDGDLRAKDADRFTFARVFGEGGRRFLVDVLDDKSYDNDFEIAENVYDAVKPQGEPRLASEITRRGAARARTGEDLVEQAFFFEEEPPRPATRSLEANVVHYNPEWVEKDPSGAVRRRRYLLPSRRFPRLPKAVFPIDDGQGTRLSRLLPKFPETGAVDLDNQFTARLNEAMPSEVRLRQATISDQGSITARPEAGRRATVPVGQARGWHFQDTYLSHYYFLVETDEESELDNDVFEIYVERGPDPFQAPPASPAAAVEFKEDLPKWFLYHRRREEGEGSQDHPVEKPAAMDLGTVIEQIRTWLLPQDGLLKAAVPPAETGPGPKARFFFQGLAGWALESDEPAGPSAVGRVLAAELMEVRGKDGEKDPGKRLLHVAVLDDVWKYQRVRTRVLRNGKDANGNKALDINRAFLMISPFSDWVDYGRDVLRLRGGVEGDLPLPAAFLDSTPLKLKDWLNPQGSSIGPVVENAIRKSFQAAGSSAPAGFWNAAEATAAGLEVSGAVLQIIPDLHPRQAKGGQPGKPVPERADELVRQLLLSTGAPALRDLTGGPNNELRRDLVRTASPWIRATWMNAKRVPVLEVTWPVRWAPGE